jgi:hypothetical protein
MVPIKDLVPKHVHVIGVNQGEHYSNSMEQGIVEQDRLDLLPEIGIALLAHNASRKRLLAVADAFRQHMANVELYFRFFTKAPDATVWDG